MCLREEISLEHFKKVSIFFDMDPEETLKSIPEVSLDIVGNDISKYTPLAAMLISISRNQEIVDYIKNRELMNESWYRRGSLYDIDETSSDDTLFFMINLSMGEIYLLKKQKKKVVFSLWQIMNLPEFCRTSDYFMVFWAVPPSKNWMSLRKYFLMRLKC
ncbi:hypothetical protein DASC09_059860 [Saccharomycopsis crataegensis]|uniref:Uncharacterized protein n=1 Tax=Saccharomycopsis crataegensis TaxID=43959 RepID=A0AAV5QW42_9ASCO|nr:hypothetical protein DASC09_059860 [Saccharomycopsis crataegensis]